MKIKLIDEISFYHLVNLENISGEVDIVPRDEKSPYHSRLSESLVTEIVNLVHVDVLVAGGLHQGDDALELLPVEEPLRLPDKDLVSLVIFGGGHHDGLLGLQEAVQDLRSGINLEKYLLDFYGKIFWLCPPASPGCGWAPG